MLRPITNYTVSSVNHMSKLEPLKQSVIGTFEPNQTPQLSCRESQPDAQTNKFVPLSFNFHICLHGIHY